VKIVMDFRKFDDVVGGVEQGVIQISRYCAKLGHKVLMIHKTRNADGVKQLFKDDENISLVPVDVDTHVMTRENARLDSGFIQDLSERENADVIHFPYNWSFPVKKKTKSIITVHDVIPLSFREAQGWWMNTFKYKPGMRRSSRLNDRIATVSEFSRQDIVNKLNVPFDKITVIPNGLREINPEDKGLEAALKERFGLTDRFILNVGGIHERKNILRLIKAFAKLVNEYGYTGKLVITGSVTGGGYKEKMKNICNRVMSETGTIQHIEFTGFISEADLDSLFRTADFLIYPSLYEGFGIPILEAMKVGIPVITSNTTGCAEVGGGIAMLTNPYDIDDIAAKMAEMASNEGLRKDMKQKGYERAQLYTWERTSEMYLEEYRKLAQR
jgi:glycosyltransferase involved in cell wall biosynthesis